MKFFFGIMYRYSMVLYPGKVFFSKNIKLEVSNPFPKNQCLAATCSYDVSFRFSNIIKGLKDLCVSNEILNCMYFNRNILLNNCNKLNITCHKYLFYLMNKSIAISPCLLISQCLNKRSTELILIRLSAPPIAQHVRNLVPSKKLYTLSIRLMYFSQLHFF